MSVGHYIVAYCSLLLLYHGQRVNAACKTYTPVDPTLYSQTYVDFTNPEANKKKPLGFQLDTYLEESSESDWPCYTVSDLAGSGRHVEVMVELAQDGTICVQSSRDRTPTCEAGKKFSMCNTVPGGAASLDYKIFCAESNCEVDQIFWFRIVREMPNSETGNYDEYWCDSREGKYPSSLIGSPPVFPGSAPPPIPTSTSASSVVSLNKKVAFISALFLYAIFYLIM